MINKFYKTIPIFQEGREYDPDSSPKAWEHYKKIYADNFLKEYDLNNACFYKWLSQKDRVEKEYHYVNEPEDPNNKDKYNRLFALKKGYESKIINNKTYFKPILRLSGETDFNFNEYNFPKFKSLLEKIDDKQKQENCLIKLEECKSNHHTLINFSLMQSSGNMQCFKKRICDERLDKFIYYLDCFYKAKYKSTTEIIKFASNANKKSLEDYLLTFSSVEDYCLKVYFIEEELVNKLIKNSKNTINKADDAMYYIDLAYEFWYEKYFNFEKSYLIIDGFFQNGGETYTHNELLNRINDNLNISEEGCNMFIKKCIERGFITNCSYGCYTR